MNKYLAVVLVVFFVIAFCMAPAPAFADDSVKKTVDIMVSPLETPIIGMKSSTTGAIVSGQTKPTHTSFRPEI